MSRPKDVRREPLIWEEYLAPGFELDEPVEEGARVDAAFEDARRGGKEQSMKAVVAVALALASIACGQSRTQAVAPTAVVAEPDGMARIHTPVPRARLQINTVSGQHVTASLVRDPGGRFAYLSFDVDDGEYNPFHGGQLYELVPIQ